MEKDKLFILYNKYVYKLADFRKLGKKIASLTDEDEIANIVQLQEDLLREINQYQKELIEALPILQFVDKFTYKGFVKKWNFEIWIDAEQCDKLRFSEIKDWAYNLNASVARISVQFKEDDTEYYLTQDYYDYDDYFQLKLYELNIVEQYLGINKYQASHYIIELSHLDRLDREIAGYNESFEDEPSIEDFIKKINK